MRHFLKITAAVLITGFSQATPLASAEAMAAQTPKVQEYSDEYAQPDDEATPDDEGKGLSIEEKAPGETYGGLNYPPLKINYRIHVPGRIKFVFGPTAKVHNPKSMTMDLEIATGTIFVVKDAPADFQAVVVLKGWTFRLKPGESASEIIYVLCVHPGVAPLPLDRELTAVGTLSPDIVKLLEGYREADQDATPAMLEEARNEVVAAIHCDLGRFMDKKDADKLAIPEECRP